MKLSEVAKKLDLTAFAGEEMSDREISGGYCSDLLSDVMGNAAAGDLWITLQVHQNIIAVAALKEVAAIVLVKGLKPATETIELSRKEGIPLFGTSATAFEIAGKLYQLLHEG